MNGENFNNGQRSDDGGDFNRQGGEFEPSRAKKERVKKKLVMNPKFAALVLAAAVFVSGVTGVEAGKAMEKHAMAQNKVEDTIEGEKVESISVAEAVENAKNFVDVEDDDVSLRLYVTNGEGFETSQDGSNVNALVELGDFGEVKSEKIECRLGEKHHYNTLTALDENGDGRFEEIQEYDMRADVTISKELNDDEQYDVRTLSQALGKLDAAKKVLAEE